MSRVAANGPQMWHLVDARGQVVGRLATQIAKLLTGKHKPTYVPHIDSGDRVVVVNARDIVFTGKKRTQKLYRWHTGYPGGLKQLTARQVFERAPERVLTAAVSGMLPKNRLRKHRLRRLRVFTDDSGIERYRSNLVGSARMASEFMDKVAPESWELPPAEETGDLVRDYIPEAVADIIGRDAYERVTTYDQLRDEFGISIDDIEIEQDKEYEAEMRDLFEQLLAEEAAGAEAEGDSDSGAGAGAGAGDAADASRA